MTTCAASFSIKRGDTSPALVFRLDPPVNLAGASVVFNLKRGRTVVIDRATASVHSNDPATLAYEWQAGDTAQAGIYRAEFEVTYADNKVETWPNRGFILVSIGRDIG